ncbi:MAG: VWA domain-containing protein [Bacillota bacterium]|nr:VWA domain-containing protein [Bacillota bacterium]
MTPGYPVEPVCQADAVEREIRRLQQLPEEKCFQRFHYRCVRRGKENEGAILLREPKPRIHDYNGTLAVAETVISAAQRRLRTGETHFVAAKDLRMLNESGAPPLEVCLLVDTSGSMNGKRIREVKALADNLVRQMHEPLSLVTFQEGDVGIKVRSTRNHEMVRRGLAAMSAAGLTPLGDGIRSAVTYLAKRRGKKHLLILITDGLPTWASGGQDVYQDALDAGCLVKKNGINFICIGLEPQRRFLEKMAKSSDASLYIVDDLDHREIAAITRREKSRVKTDIH